jgi:hypothetical protein
MKKLLLLLLLVIAGLNTPRDATACGGPDYGAFGALAPLDSALFDLTMPEAEWASWGNAHIDELRFLYPFRKKADLAWQFAHENLEHAPPLALTALDDAMRRGDLAAIDREARRVIDQLLDLPAPLAAEQSTLFWRAVELVELGPVLARVSAAERRDYLRGAVGAPMPRVLQQALDARRAEPGPASQQVPSTAGHPRAASLALWDAIRDVRTKIPNGYRDAIQKQVPAATFQSLQQAFARWRAAHPKHPLVDYARLYELRVAYLAGDGAAAWQVLFDIYPRHLGRVVSEMRYLRVQGLEPSAQQVDQVKDPLLIAALANESTITAARWHRWWKLAGSAPNQQNLKERLLAWSAKHSGSLPPEFPKDATKISPLAAELSAIAWMAAGRPAVARSQLEKLPTDVMQARLLAKARLAQGKVEQAAAVSGLTQDVRRYLIRVRLPTASLVRLEKSKDAEVAMDARIEHAARLGRKGRWRDAAKLMDGVDRDRAELYRHVGKLTRLKEWLELARFFEDQRGRMYFDDDPSFYRGISTRWELPKGKKEARQIEGALVRGTARWLALEAYTRWLVAHPKDQDSRDVLSEADRAYSRLTNFGGGDWFFWGKYQKKSPTIRRLREVGKVIRKKQP